jgi:hypothetical protein
MNSTRTDREVADPNPNDVGPHVVAEALRDTLAAPREGIQGQQTPADGDLQPNEREGWNILQRALRQHARKGGREERCQGLRNRDDAPVQSRRLTLKLTRDRSVPKGWAFLADLGPQERWPGDDHDSCRSARL